MKKIAVVLFNLGGPDRQESVKPFLFNLFNDPAIISLPNPLRFLLAHFISARREKEARHIYAQIGGGSPIVPLTQQQAEALESELNGANSGTRYGVFAAMRYWHPFAADALAEVENFGPDEIVLLPLYPQFSTTTTASSLKEWRRLQERSRLKHVTAREICCYPLERYFIAAHAELIRPAYAEAEKHGKPRVLFSAHGLPERVIAKGDPYQWQVEQTAKSIADSLGIPDLDWRVCYQSRVGKMKWIEPYTDAEIRRAGTESRPLVVSPIAFVSEHSETLVELDIQYKTLAKESSVPAYVRVPALGTGPAFIKALAGLCAMEEKRPRICPENFSKCWCAVGRSVAV